MSRGDIDFEQLFPRRRRPRVVPTGGGRRRHKRRPILWSIVGIIVLLLLAGNWILSLRVSYLFYASVHHTNVFWTPLIAQVVLFLIGFVVLGALVAINLPFWNRIARNLDEQSAKIGRFAGLAVVAVCALGGGLFLSGEWQTVLSFLHEHSFGVKDPVFHEDVSFYVFTLPFIDAVVGILWAAVLISLVVALGLLITATIAVKTPEEIPMPLVPVEGGSHDRARLLSMRLTGVAMVFVFLLSAVGAHYTVYHMVTSYHSDTVNFYGMDATQMNVDRPILGALQWIALLAAVLMVAALAFGWQGKRAVRMGGWTATLTIVWLVINAVVQTVPSLIYAAAVVTPNAQTAQNQAITNYLDMSRDAWGLTSSDVDTRQFGGTGAPTLADLAADPGTLNNVRIQDQTQLTDTLNQIERTKTFQTFPTITVDRYATPSGDQEVMVAPREVDANDLNNQSFTSTAEIYTHGYGVSAVSVDQVGDSGKPLVLEGGQPMEPEGSATPPTSLNFDGQSGPSGLGGVGDPRIFCGLSTTQPVVVNTTVSEFNYPSSGGDNTSHAGSVQGIPITNEFDKLALSLETFGGTNLLLTNTLTSQSEVLLNRTIQSRVSAIAPFLTLDNDPYVVVDPQTNHLMYIEDAYVTSANYPDSYQQSNGTDYMYNAVKAVVDAKTCQTTLYMTNPDEPMTATYNAIYPGVMKPLSSMPMYLREHLRYPEDLFTAQATVYGQVHVPNANVFFNNSNAWAPSQEVVNGSPQTAAPYYVELTLPCPSDNPNCTRTPSFVLMQTFSPANGSGSGSANNMTAWLAAECNYTQDLPDGQVQLPQLVSVPINNGANVLGPLQFDYNINSNPTISAEITLLSQGGSEVILGNVIVLPFNDDSFLYVRPLYVAAANSGTASFPQLRYIIVGDKNGVAYGATFEAALQSLYGTTQPIAGLVVSGSAPTTVPPPTSTTPPTTSVGEKVPPGTTALITDLLNHEALAQQALRNDNLVTYGQQEAIVQQDAAQLRTLLGVSGSSGAAPATASPSPTSGG